MATSYFMQNFALGIYSGIALRELRNQIRQERALEEASDALADADALDPFAEGAGILAGASAYDPVTGQPTGAAPNAEGFAAGVAAEGGRLQFDEALGTVSETLGFDGARRASDTELSFGELGSVPDTDDPEAEFEPDVATGGGTDTLDGGAVFNKLRAGMSMGTAEDRQRQSQVSWSYELDGKARPNRPQDQLLEAVDAAVAATFGPGASVVLFSGMEDEGQQHGSNRHRTGLAGDFRIYDAEGRRVTSGDPRARQFIQNAAAAGILGIGAGPEYMDGNFHLDMVPHENYTSGQGPVWGSTAAAMRDSVVPVMQSSAQERASRSMAPAGSPGTAASRPGGGFRERLIQRESSGNPDLVNDWGYTGLYQFGQPRLDDYNRVHGTNITTQSLVGNPDLQHRVADWHFGDIDRAIAALDTNMDPDGLRAVAHLGGIGGMRQFVRTRGSYNPADQLGTRLSDYYEQFSGSGDMGPPTGSSGAPAYAGTSGPAAPSAEDAYAASGVPVPGAMPGRTRERPQPREDEASGIPMQRQLLTMATLEPQRRRPLQTQSDIPNVGIPMIGTELT